MKKIVILQDIPMYGQRLSAIAPGWDIVFTKHNSEAIKELPDAEIVVGWTNAVEKVCASENSAVRWIQTWSAGVDKLPFDMLQEKKIAVTNTSGVHARPLSESIFGAMLAMTRGIPASLDAQAQKKWQPTVVENAYPIGEIHGKTIGILGTGHIGEEVARIARAFSMEVLGLRRNKKPTPYVDKIYSTNELEEMLSHCDFVVNILPLTDSTRNLINEKAFAAMQKGTCYLNFGRGGTTDTTALVEALQSGQVGYAALDVVNPEPLPSDHPLWKQKNIIITPHIAGNTPYYTERAMSIFMENLKSYLKIGAPSINVINLDRTY